MKGRGDDTGRDGVDADLVSHHLLGPSSRRGRDEAFRARIDYRAATPAVARRDRGYVDDVAAPLLAHHGNNLVHEHRDLRHIERQNLPQIVVAIVVDLGAADHPPCVIDQDIDSSVRGERLGNDALHVRGLRNVTADQVRLATHCLDVAGDHFCGLLARVVMDQQSTAQTCKCACGRGSDAR